MVADNDPDALELLEVDLRLEGHDVVGSATGGMAAIALCEALSPDVLVIDLRMPPGPDGLAVAAELKSQADLRVVLYTNYRSLLVQERADALGVTYLLKGDLRSLRAAVGGRANA